MRNNKDMKKPMPAIFFGHGNPINTLLDNDFTRGWSAVGSALPRPRAVLSVSAHWYIDSTSATAMPRPRTIHDFGGFPQELYEIRYPAPGAPDLAVRLQKLLAPLPVGLDEEWGLDHGTWTVLRHVFPDAGIPVIQLSIDRTMPAAYHFEIGKRLSELRDEGVLIVGSGNLVHNLRLYSWDQPGIKPFDWVVTFEKKARELLISGDYEALLDYKNMGPDARLSIPTPDHYLPLLYVIAMRREGEKVSFPVEGFDGGSMSMLAVQIG